MKHFPFKTLSGLFLISAYLFLMPSFCSPLEMKAQKDKAAEELSSQELVKMAWEASGAGDLEKVTSLKDKCFELYGRKAKEKQELLKGFPTRGEEGNYQELNDVGTCLFIHAEALMNKGKTEEAIVAFKEIIEEYGWAQAWDPSRGSYWSIKEKSQASIDVMTGQEEDEEIRKTVKSIPTITNEGADKIVDYEKYGKFHGIGTKDYSFEVTDGKGLSRAVGQGVFPNSGAVFREPRYRQLRKDGRLKGSHWDFVNVDDLEAAYYKWICAPEPWGTKLFYLGLIYEKAGLYYRALKAYHALVVHFPTSVAWTYWQTPWYPAQAAIAKIKHVVRTHPELNLHVRNMRISIVNGYDNDPENDTIVTNPGSIIENGSKQDRVELGEVKKEVGQGKVRLVQYANGHWQLLLNDEPYVIKGVTYAPTKVGQSPDKKTLVYWMEEDTDGNGRLDGPYDSWVDKNFNNRQDDDESVVGDFQLMKEMGANTIREYHQPFEPKKEVLRDMYEKHGLRVIMGDFLGKYTLGSGAGWFEGTDYENEEHKKNMMAAVKKMVEDHKDEPYLLLWLLGNENNYGVASNADKKPEAYFKFANEVAKMIKSIDKDHPVALCNGDTLFLDKFAELTPDIDIFSANVYRGDYGFGSFWEQVNDTAGKPAFITEYGCPAYARHLTLEEAEEAQANYHLGNWLDIKENLAGGFGIGNALGGIAFEWTDEWWKNYEPYRHDRKSDAIGPFPGGYYFEEWFGLTSQGNGRHSPFLRQLRKSYNVYKEVWN